METNLLRVCVAAVAAALWAMPASAQPAISSRPFRGLFGGIAPDRQARERLEFTLSVGEGYDDDVFFELRRGTLRSAGGTRGFYSMLAATGEYDKHGQRVRFAASASAMLRYYNQLSEVKTLGQTAGLGVSTAISRRTTFTVNQTVAYSPSYLYSLFPVVQSPDLGEGAPAAPDYATANLASYSYGTRAELRQALASRGAVFANANFRYLDYVHGNPLRRNALTYGAGAGFSRGVAQHSSFTTRYRYRVSDLTYRAATTTEHGISMGFDYGRALSSVRSVDLRFDIGASTIDFPEIEGDPVHSGRRSRLTGGAAVGYRFNRTWWLRGTYSRDVEYLTEVPQPLFTSGGTASVTGLFTRRLDFLAAGGYARGTSALYRGYLPFETYTANLQLRYALSSALAAHAEYLYYFYNFRGVSPLPLTLPPEFERQGVRAGITLWLSPLQR